MHCKSYSHFFSKKFQNICVSLDVNFNESLTNDIVSFEQLGPETVYGIEMLSYMRHCVIKTAASKLTYLEDFGMLDNFKRPDVNKTISKFIVLNMICCSVCLV